MLRRDLRHLLVPGVAAHFITDPSTTAEPLHPAEAAAVVRAVPKRQREFSLGRQCARRALVELGVDPSPIPTGPGRGPVWPEGFTGSITHFDGFVGAVVGSRGIVDSVGFDAEPIEHLPLEVRSLVLTDAEVRWIRDREGAMAGEWDKLFFCAKEALHKCLNPVNGVWLDFQDVTVVPQIATGLLRYTWTNAGPATSRCGDPARLRGRFVARGGHVFAVTYLPAEGGKAASGRTQEP